MYFDFIFFILLSLSYSIFLLMTWMFMRVNFPDSKEFQMIEEKMNNYIKTPYNYIKNIFEEKAKVN